MTFENGVVGVRQTILHSRQNSFYTHKSDLMLDPIIEQVKNNWPNGFELVVLKLRFPDLHQLKIHGVHDDCATRLEWLTNYLNWKVHFVIFVDKYRPCIDCPFQIVVLAETKSLKKDNWLSRIALVFFCLQIGRLLW